MSRFTTLVVLFVLISGGVLSAQPSDSVIVIGEVSVVAAKDRYLTGSKARALDTAMLSLATGKSLAELVNISLPIYVKQDAGGLATIRIRGTGPNHTAVLFNGININSQTLGHSNISSLPVFLFEEVRIQYGSSSSLYGSDAIGGSLQLNNRAQWNRGLELGVQQDVGSFGAFFSGVKAGFSNAKLHCSVKAYRQWINNDFPFVNTAVKDFERNEFVNDTMRNAAVSNMGALQSVSFKASDRLSFHGQLWLESNWYQIQPNMSANYYGGAFEEIKNDHVRLVAGVKYHRDRHRITADFGFVNDHQLYQKNYGQTIANNTYSVNANYHNSHLLSGSLNVGMSYSYLLPKVYAYQGGVNESRLDVFALYTKSLAGRMQVTANVREALVTGYGAQFAPSLGLNYRVRSTPEDDLTVGLSAARSFKTPTFNDRFWNPGGNPGIRPEKGLSVELNSGYWRRGGGAWEVKANLSVYYMLIDDLIQWVSRDIWRPENIKKTASRGAEVSATLSKQWHSVKVSSGVSYSLTRATEVDTYGVGGAPAGRQLIYTPTHVGNAHLMLSGSGWIGMLIASFVGDRYTESYRLLNGYSLLNASLEKQLHRGKHRFVLGFRVNNLLNKSYQNQYLYAMPGVSYNLSFKYLITNN